MLAYFEVPWVKSDAKLGSLKSTFGIESLLLVGIEVLVTDWIRPLACLSLNSSTITLSEFARP